MRKAFLIITLACFSICGILEAGVSKSELVVIQAVDKFMTDLNVPGVAIGVFYNQNGQVYTFGVADKKTQKAVTGNTIFDIASLTKVFTATELAIQVESGRMAFSDSVAKYLPGLNQPGAPIQNVTLQELATHTSSLPRTPPASGQNHPPNQKTLIHYFQNWRPDYPIGTHFLYSNIAYGLLGYTMARARGETYQQLIREDILKPLGMERTMIVVPPNLQQDYATGYKPDGEPAQRWPMVAWPGGGSLRSTANDMLSFLEANLGARGTQELIEAMQTAQKPYYKVSQKLTIGLGWQLVHANGLFYIDKNGGVPGFSSYIGMLPDKKIGVVILANKAKTNITAFGRQLLRQLDEALQTQ